MAGSGSRFKRAGYKCYKPFIKINDKFMIDYVIDNFPKEIKKFFLVDRNLLTDDQLTYLSQKNNSTIIVISPHKLGPAYSVFEAKEKLPLKESFFIAYNDIYWEWNYHNIFDSLDEEGIIFVKKGFHPHLIKPSHSGFCVADEERKNYVKALNVKGSFTDDWMNKEFLDTAVYFFKKGTQLVENLALDIDQNNKISGEYFIPSALKRMISHEIPVMYHEVDFFVHWGIPEQLEDYNLWNDAFSNKDLEFLEKYKTSNDRNYQDTFLFWSNHFLDKNN